MSKITNTGVFIVEGSAAAADVAGSSQIWVKSDAPSSLYHTDDAGTDFRINGTTVSAQQATTSLAARDFTGIPAGCKQIVLMIVGVSTSGSSVPIIQLGDSDGFETSGYLGGVGDEAGIGNFTDGFKFNRGWASSLVAHGSVIFNLQTANVWAASGCISFESAAFGVLGGTKSLTGELTQLRITTQGGSDTFDAGAASIQFQ